MNIAIYAVILGILVAMTLMGYRKGFLKTIVSMSALLVSLIFVNFLSTPITNFLDTETSIRQDATEKIYEELSNKIDEDYAESADEQKESIAETFIPDSLIEEYEKNIEPMNVLDDYVMGLAEFAAGKVVNIAVFLLTLLVAFIVTKVITLATHLISKVPIIGGANKILGAILGFVRGVIIVWILLFILTVFSSTVTESSALVTIKDSNVLSLFYDGALSFGQLFGIF